MTQEVGYDRQLQLFENAMFTVVPKDWQLRVRVANDFATVQVWRPGRNGTLITGALTVLTMGIVAEMESFEQRVDWCMAFFTNSMR